MKNPFKWKLFQKKILIASEYLKYLIKSQPSFEYEHDLFGMKEN